MENQTAIFWPMMAHVLLVYIIYAMLDAHGLLAAPDLATSNGDGDSSAPDLLP